MNFKKNFLMENRNKKKPKSKIPNNESKIQKTYGCIDPVNTTLFTESLTSSSIMIPFFTVFCRIIIIRIFINDLMILRLRFDQLIKITFKMY